MDTGLLHRMRARARMLSFLCLVRFAGAAAIDVTVDCSNDLGPFRHFWASTGFTPADMMMQPHYQMNMAYLGSVPHHGVQWARIHHMLALVGGTGFDTDQPTYDWARFDYCMDLLVNHGIRPLFELMGDAGGQFGYKCSYQGVPCFQADYKIRQWRDIVRETAKHCLERYGKEEVYTWLWEPWNEHGGVSQLNHYDACYEGLKAADPELAKRLGGSGDIGRSSTLNEIMAHCDTGTNCLTGEKGVPWAFAARQAKGSPNGQVSGILEDYDYIRTHHPRYKDIPWVSDEADPRAGWFLEDSTYEWRGEPWFAGFVCRMVNTFQLRAIDSAGIDIRIVSVDNGFCGNWRQRTHLAQIGSSKGNFTLLKKPVHNVMALLALLGDRRLGYQPVLSADRDIGVIATAKAGDYIAVLLYRQRDDLPKGVAPTAPAETVALTLKGVPFARAMVAHYRIDGDHTNPYKVWRDLGLGHKSIPTKEQFARVIEHNELARLGAPEEATVLGEELSCSVELPLPGVHLLVLSGAAAADTHRIDGIEIVAYPGLFGEGESLLFWKGMSSHHVKTYEVRSATSADGPFERINGTDIVCTAFMDRRQDRADSYYQIAAVDYWGRTIGLSDVTRNDGTAVRRGALPHRAAVARAAADAALFQVYTVRGRRVGSESTRAWRGPRAGAPARAVYIVRRHTARIDGLRVRVR